MKLDELRIGKPAIRALARVGVDSLEKCVEYTYKELLELYGIGPKAIRIIKEEYLKLNLKYKSDKK